MNTVLFCQEDIQENAEFEVSGDRAQHMLEHQGAEKGRQFRVALAGGKLGTAAVLLAEPERIRLKIENLQDEPLPPRVDLIVGVSRPQTVKKVLELGATLGVQNIFFVRARETQKSYLSSKIFHEENLFHHLRLGLEQAGSSHVPRVGVHTRLKPFVEDVLPSVRATDGKAFIADPRAGRDLLQTEYSGPQSPQGPRMLAIGPEGGWHDFEVRLFEEHGFLPISLGQRILRVEHALCYLLGQVALARSLFMNNEQSYREKKGDREKVNESIRVIE